MSETPEWWDTRAFAPDHREVIGSWKPASAAYYKEHPPEVLKYGEGDRHTMDLFDAGHGRSPMLFIHGGFWQVPLDKSYFAHMAKGPNALDVPVAVMSYDLCPNVGIGDILGQARKAVRVLLERYGQPIVVSGHSAGGQLAACLLATEASVKAAYALSGVFDLRGLIGTPLNTALRLDPESAEKLSPLLWNGPQGKPFEAVVGAQESEGFREQTAAMVRAWGEQGVVTQRHELQDKHHFNIIAGLADPNSPTSQRILEMVNTR
jgi:arylformamidase